MHIRTSIVAWNEEGETLSLARKHLSNNGYSLALNNCEHFAAYCATGKKKSKQVRKALSVVLLESHLLSYLIFFIRLSIFIQKFVFQGLHTLHGFLPDTISSSLLLNPTILLGVILFAYLKSGR